MTAIFSKVVPKLLTAEGVTSDSPIDYGGLTKYGLSQRSYPHIDFDTLTVEGACKIYETDYWDKYRLGEIIDQSIADQTFLLLINMNPPEAITIVQNAVNNCGRTITAIATDGVLGSGTIGAINGLNRFWLSDRIRVEAVKFYLARTDKDHSQIPNLRSWLRRTLL